MIAIKRRKALKLKEIKICKDAVGVRDIGKLNITETDPREVIRNKRICDSFYVIT